MGEDLRTQPFDDLEVTNQCVVVCRLDQWVDSGSQAWSVIRGTQDEVGDDIAGFLQSAGVERIEDFGGVGETFLCDGDVYVDEPPRIRGRAAVFSFTPKNRLAAEGQEMARVSAMAGYRIMVLTVQKHKKYGKVWVLNAVLANLRPDDHLTYYEDTNTVIDELKSGENANRVSAVHVQAPGFEQFTSQLADRVVTQDQYRLEVIKPSE